MSLDLEQEFSGLFAEVAEIAGVKPSGQQRRVILSRVLRRAMELGLEGLPAYLEHFRLHRDGEISALVTFLSPEQSAFFREPSHFQFLEASGLPAIIGSAKARNSNKIRVFSAGCGFGQECYSLAMFFNVHLPNLAPEFTYEILGVDKNLHAIQMAEVAIYSRDEIKVVPARYLGQNWRRDEGISQNMVRAAPSIRDRCVFRAGDLLDPNSTKDEDSFDLIFCRNVMMYFAEDDVRRLLALLLSKLQPTGFLVLGAAEVLADSGMQFGSVGPAIYRPRGQTSVMAPESLAAPIRVLCVDDSMVILNILRKILTPDHGFEVVAVAQNGLEAAEMVKKTPFDVMTLDIHMPKQDGLSYLRANFSKTHRPVVMFSSVTREDADLAGKCLQAGATDYIEKPSLATMQLRAEEIRYKVRAAAQISSSEHATTSIDQAFANEIRISAPEGKLRLIIMRLEDSVTVSSSLRELSGRQPATLIVVDWQEVKATLVEDLARDLALQTNLVIKRYSKTSQLSPGALYLGSMKDLGEVTKSYPDLAVSILAYCSLSTATISALCSFEHRQALIAEGKMLPANADLQRLPHDFVPTPSFISMSNQFLAKVPKKSRKSPAPNPPTKPESRPRLNIKRGA